MNPDLIIERLKKDHDSLLRELLNYYKGKSYLLNVSDHLPNAFSVLWYIRSLLNLPLPYDNSFLYPEKEDHIFIRDIKFLNN